jgi:hypothetical protein
MEYIDYFRSPNCIKDIRSKISKDLLTGGGRTVDQLDAHWSTPPSWSANSAEWSIKWVQKYSYHIMKE